MKKLLLIIMILMALPCLALDRDIIFHHHFDGAPQDFTPDWMPLFAYTYSAYVNNYGIPRLVPGGVWGEYYYSAQGPTYSGNYNYLRFSGLGSVAAGEDYTIDFWTNMGFSQFGNYGDIFANKFEPNEYPYAAVKLVNYGIGTYDFVYNSPDGSILAAYAATGWSHIAIVREGSVLTTYKNGVLSHTRATPAYAIDFAELQFGNNFESGNNYNHIEFKLDEFRITRGAKWSAPFTPPTEPYAYAPIQAKVFMQKDGKTHLQDNGEIKLDWSR